MSNKHTISVKLFRSVSALITAVLLWSCSTFPENDMYIDRSYGNRHETSGSADRNSHGHRDRVFIVYSMGFNNLSHALNEDINELLSGDIPSFHPKDNALLILNQSTQNNKSNYRIETSPVLYHAYKTIDGKVKRDTLMVFPEGSAAASKEILSEVLTYVKTEFPATHYGMLVSSHATGRAPEMYCYSPPDKSSSGMWMSKEKNFKPLDKYTSDKPLTRSIGSHFHGGASNAEEIELQDFAEVIPFHLDFLIFDCCLMGCVEDAYELKDKCDKICASQTEILSEGMDYRKMAEYVFSGEEADLEAIAQDYYMKYAEKSDDTSRSATVSVVDCRKLDAVAEIIKKNTATIKTLADGLDRVKVQAYFQKSLARNHGIFFDLEDIVIKSGADESTVNELKDAMENCIICRYATPTFLTYLKIEHHSGLSMYLPDPAREILNKYYVTLKWNKATGLITDKE